MDAEQRRQLHQDGYLIVKGAISADLVQRLNHEIDLRLQHEFGTAVDIPHRVTYDNGALHPSHGAREGRPFAPHPGWMEEPIWGAGGHFSTTAFRELIEPPSMSPILSEILGDPEWLHVPEEVAPEQRGRWRLDHDNLHVAPAWPWQDDAGQTMPGLSSVGGGVHGGPAARHITCVYELIDVEPGTGGFGCIPGSHRHDFQWPAPPFSNAERPQWGAPVELEDGRWGWPPEVPLRRLECRAGDCLLFTEKLSHATVPWSGRRQRRTLFNKYVPFGIHHVDRQYAADDPELTPSQRARLEFPEQWFNTAGPNSPFHLGRL